MPAEVDQQTMTSPHIDDVPGHAGAAAHHALDDHGDDHGHDDHAHGEEALGPIDVRAWGAGVVGVLLGLIVTVAFVLATA
jgi:hypothetical protein